MSPLLAEPPRGKPVELEGLQVTDGTPSTISGMMLTGLALPDTGVLAVGLSTHGADGGEKMISSSSAAGLAIQDERPETMLGGPMGMDEDEEAND